MSVNNFAIGQRVRVVRVGDWNGTPPCRDIQRCVGRVGRVAEIRRDTIGVEITHINKYLGVVQFLCNELIPIGD